MNKDHKQVVGFSAVIYEKGPSCRRFRIVYVTVDAEEYFTVERMNKTPHKDAFFRPNAEKLLLGSGSAVLLVSI